MMPFSSGVRAATSRSASALVVVAVLLVAPVLAPQPTGAHSLDHTARAVIHPGDQLSVVIYGESMLSQTVTVQSDGRIDYPLIGPVEVGGISPERAAALLQRRLSLYVIEPVVSISISQLGQPTVLVLGAVKDPGKYQLPSGAKLSDAIAAANGLGDTDGAYPDARITYPDHAVKNVSLEGLLRRGDDSLDLSLADGSVVYVEGPTTFNVSVTGAVDHPGDIVVREGDPIEVAISKAGDSATAESDLNHVRIIRNIDGTAKSIDVNVYQEMQSGRLTQVQKGDIVVVPQARKKADIWGSGIWWLLSRLIP